MSDDALPEQDYFTPPDSRALKSTPRRSFAEWCMVLALGVPWLWARRPPFVQSLAAIRRGGTEALIIGAIVVFVAVAWQATFEHLIIIQPISIPKSLEAEGYTSTIVAQRLIDQVQKIGDASGSRRKRAAFGSESKFAALSTIQVPAAGFSFRSLIATLRDLLKIEDTTIGGEVVFKRAADGRGPNEYVLNLRLDGPGGRYVGEVQAVDVDNAISSAARIVVGRLDVPIMAEYLLRVEDWKGAEELAASVSEMTDKDMAKWAPMIRGQVKEAIHKFDEAISFYQQASLLDPGFAEAFAKWARALAGQREYASAIEKIQSALKLDEGFALAHVIWGDVLFDQHHYDEAIENYRVASVLDPRDEAPLASWAELLEFKQDYPGAIDKCRQAIYVNPKDPRSYNVCGSIYQSIRDLNAAKTMYERVAVLRPADAGARKNWADLLKTTGNYDAAIQQYSEACKVQPSYIDAKVAWADALVATQRFDEAIEKYRELADEKPEYSEEIAKIELYRDRGAVP